MSEKTTLISNEGFYLLPLPAHAACCFIDTLPSLFYFDTRDATPTRLPGPTLTPFLSISRFWFLDPSFEPALMLSWSSLLLAIYVKKYVSVREKSYRDTLFLLLTTDSKFLLSFNHFHDLFVFTVLSTEWCTVWNTLSIQKLSWMRLVEADVGFVWNITHVWCKPILHFLPTLLKAGWCRRRWNSIFVRLLMLSSMAVVVIVFLLIALFLVLTRAAFVHNKIQTFCHYRQIIGVVFEYFRIRGRLNDFVQVKIWPCVYFGFVVFLHLVCIICIVYQ